MNIKLIRILFCMLLISLSACAGKTIENQNNAMPSNEAVPVGLEIGNRAPELVFKSPDGTPIALSSLRGRIVLIDFWASWCMPCRAENPKLVNVYRKFRKKKFSCGKKFTIYSVSLDTKYESWVHAIEKDGLEWTTHVSDLKGWRSEPAGLYQVNAIPAGFVIDGRGIILAKGLRAAELEIFLKGLLR